jgi:hypothetical protein
MTHNSKRKDGFIILTFVLFVSAVLALLVYNSYEQDWQLQKFLLQDEIHFQAHFNEVSDL